MIRRENNADFSTGQVTEEWYLLVNSRTRGELLTILGRSEFAKATMQKR